MRAMLPRAWRDFRGRVRGLLDAHRANLRSRTYATAAFNPPTAPYEVVPVTTRDGARLRVHVYGPSDRQTIVLVHGWTCAIEYWNAQINAFAEDYRVVAFDMRGHGESTLGTDPLNCELLAEDLATVLDATLRPGERAVLVAHSLGGMTVQAWAGRYPERVQQQARAVLLTNSAPDRLLAETMIVPFCNVALPIPKLRIALPYLMGRLGLGTPILFPPIRPVKWAFARQIMSLASTGDVVDFSLAIVRSCRARVRAKFGILLAEMDLGDAARNLVVPTTILAGAFDHMTPPVHSEKIVQMLRETGSLAKYEVLPTGHLSNIEMFERFNQELTTVLESIRRRAEAAS